MPRKGRIDFPGALHHIIIRGINRNAIFCNHVDRREFVLRLGQGLDETKLLCYAWALLPNHVHLLLRTTSGPLTDLMRSLLTGYALYFNKRHARVGYLFQNRYKSILCDEEQYLLQLIRYIHLNPLRARLVPDLQELNRYHWCGHAVLLGNQRAKWQAIDEVLGRFGNTIKEARINYLDFMREGVLQGKRPDLTGGGLVRSAGGWEGVKKLHRSGDRWRGDERILGDGDFVNRILKAADEQLTRETQGKASGLSLERLLICAAECCAADVQRIRSRKKDLPTTQARAVFSWWPTDNLSYSLADVSRFLKVSAPAIFKAAQRGKEIVQERKLQLPVG